MPCGETERVETIKDTARTHQVEIERVDECGRLVNK